MYTFYTALAVEGRKCRSGEGTAFVYEVTAPSPTTKEVTDCFHANLMNSRDGDLVLKVLKESAETVDRALGLCTTQKS